MNQSSLDRIIQEEQERGTAAQKLKEIADRFPDLFEKVAKAFLGQRDLLHEVKQAMKETRTQRKQSPTDAVVEWLKENGECTSSLIARALSDKIETKSDNPAAIIHSTLSSLERRGVVESFKSAEGKTFALK